MYHSVFIHDEELQDTLGSGLFHMLRIEHASRLEAMAWPHRTRSRGGKDPYRME